MGRIVKRPFLLSILLSLGIWIKWWSGLYLVIDVERSFTANIREIEDVLDVKLVLKLWGWRIEGDIKNGAYVQ
jgi:hypothetical protein